MNPPARTPQQRKQDTLHRLEHDVDAWVATASPDDDTPYLVPLSFHWDGTTLLLATPADSPAGRNLETTKKVRLALGATRDVIIIEGTVETVPPGELPAELGDAYAARTGWDPRKQSAPTPFYRVSPQLVQAWREVNELRGRNLMVDGSWQV